MVREGMQQGMPPDPLLPSRLQIPGRAPPVAPLSHVDLVEIKAPVREEVLEPDVRPATAINRIFVDPDKERRRYEKDAAGAEHRMHVFDGPAGPQHVFEYLFRDHEIIGAICNRTPADVVVGIIQALVVFETEAAPRVAANFENHLRLRFVGADSGASDPVHMYPDPVPVGVAQKVLQPDKLCLESWGRGDRGLTWLLPVEPY